MIQFISQHFDLICLVIIASIILILSIIICAKLGKKSTSLILSLLLKLPQIINDAESKGFSSGESKLKYVLELAINYLSAVSGKSPSKITKQYGALVENAVEDILTTPQKKEE